MIEPCNGYDKETEISEALLKLDKIKATLKFDGGKPSFSNIPQKALWEVMRAYKHGEEKYGKYNHSTGCEHVRLTDGAIRHIMQYLMNTDDKDIDESGTHHLANAAANCLMLLDQILNKVGVDNRNPSYIKHEVNKETTNNS